jgi:hypothetical protein
LPERELDRPKGDKKTFVAKTTHSATYFIQGYQDDKDITPFMIHGGGGGGMTDKSSTVLRMERIKGAAGTKSSVIRQALWKLY